MNDFISFLRSGYREYAYSRRLAARFPHAKFHDGARIDAECRLGEGVVIGANTKLFKCTIGRNTFFAPDSKLICCTIGAFCSFGPEVLAGLGKHPSRDFVSTHPAFFSQSNICDCRLTSRQKFEEFEPITIGSDVWVGARVIISDGVTIGHGAIVGAAAVVTRDVEPYSIVGGVPARVIRKRFADEDIQFLLKLAWWDKDMEWIRTHAEEFENIEALRRS
jgi:acetyltransferase-like isoleucine patch superfamily enzyme